MVCGPTSTVFLFSGCTISENTEIQLMIKSKCNITYIIMLTQSNFGINKFHVAVSDI